MSYLSTWNSNYSSGYYTGGSSRTYTASSGRLNTIKRDAKANFASEFEDMEYYIENNQYAKAVEIYNDVKAQMPSFCENYNVDIEESAYKTILDEAFQKATGKKITSSIQDTTSNSFWTGVKEGLPFIGWLCNGMTEQEAISEFRGEEVSTKEKVKEGLGAGLSGAVVGAGAVAGVSVAGAMLAGAAIGSSIPVAGTIIGAVIGAGIGLAQCFTKNKNKN